MSRVYECLSSEPSEWGYIISFKPVNGFAVSAQVGLIKLVTEQLAEFEVGKRYTLQMSEHDV